MSVELNGQPVLELRIQEPLTGNWTAEVEIDSDVIQSEGLVGPAVIDVDGVIFTGSILRSAVDEDLMRLFVVGGAGGLAQELAPRDYFQTALTLVLADFFTAAGEALDPTSDTAALNRQLNKWTRPRDDATNEIKRIADAAGLRWRVQRTGLVNLGTDLFLPIDPPHDELNFDAETGVMTIAPDDIDPFFALVGPGVTFKERKVGHAETIVTGTSIEQNITFLDADGKERGGPWQEIRKVVNGIVKPAVKLAAFYAAEAFVQNPVTKLIDVTPDSDVLRDGIKGMGGLQMRHGMPGVRVTLSPKSRVMIAFDANDPSKAFAALWEEGTPVKELSIEVLTELRLGDDGATNKVARADRVENAISAMLATGIGVTGTDAFAAAKTAWDTALGTSASPPPTTVGADKVKAE